jgi:hypothetical protein
MRPLIGLIPLLLFIGTGSALAAPVHYTIQFSLTSGSTLPTSGSFDYDSSTSTFTSFDVVWNSDTFDLTSQANSPQNFLLPTDPCYSGSTNGAQVIFLLMTTCSADANPTYYTGPPIWFGASNPAPGNGPTSAASFDIFTVPEAHNLLGACIGNCSISNLSEGGFSSTSAPEPGTTALMLIGLCMMLRKCRLEQGR